MTSIIPNLRTFIERLRLTHDIVDITTSVNPHLEIAEIHRRVIAADGPALLFHNVQGSPFPVVTNLFGATRRIELAFGTAPQEWMRNGVEFLQHHMPPSAPTLWKHRHLLKPLLHLKFI